MTIKTSKQLQNVARTKYKNKYKNILIGHVIVSFNKIFGQLENQDPVLDFVKMNMDNDWKATRDKAKKFLRKHEKSIK